MGKTEMEALRKALILLQKAKGNIRGCLEISVAALGGKVQTHHIKGADVNSWHTDDSHALEKRHKIIIAAQFHQTKPVHPTELAKLLEHPNAGHKTVQVPRVRGVRGTLITIDHDQNNVHHALAVLRTNRLGKLGRQLASQNLHPVVDRAIDENLITLPTETLAKYLNLFFEEGAQIVFRHISRLNKPK